MTAIKPYLGFILIIAGLALAFAGRKFVIPAFAFLIFLASSGLIFLICYNFLPAGTVSPVWLGVLLFVSCLIGGFVAYVTKKFADEWSMSLLAAWGGIVLGLIIAKMAGVRSGAASLGIAGVGAVVGGCLGKKMNHLAKCAGTSFVGAFLTIRGAGMFAPQKYAYPSEF